MADESSQQSAVRVSNWTSATATRPGARQSYQTTDGKAPQASRATAS